MCFEWTSVCSACYTLWSGVIISSSSCVSSCLSLRCRLELHWLSPCTVITRAQKHQFSHKICKTTIGWSSVCSQYALTEQCLAYFLKVELKWELSFFLCKEISPNNDTASIVYFFLKRRFEHIVWKPSTALSDDKERDLLGTCWYFLVCSVCIPFGKWKLVSLACYH